MEAPYDINLVRNKKFVERGKIGEAARAFESFEKVTGIDVFLPMVGVVLEKFMAGFRMTQTAERAELSEVQIADRRAGVGASGISVNVA